jgi:ABC-type phosphate transport system substrate-binding protein
MKKIVIVCTLLVFSMVLTGCKQEETDKEVIIKLGGSTSVEKAIQAVATAFEAEVPTFEFEMNQTGSSDGYKRTLGGEKDSNPAHIGFASRGFKSSEIVTNGLLSGTFATDAIAVVVHKDHALTNITSEQLLKVYTGEISNWSQIDSSLNGTINVYSRDASSGTRGAFQEIVGFEDAELVDSSIITTGNGDLATKVGNDQNGIGYVSLSTDFEANGITPLIYNGVEATEAETLAGTYTLSRPFNFVTRAEDDFGTEEEKQMVEAFIAYLGTKDAIAIMVNEGVIVDATNAPTWNDIKDDYSIVNK